MFSKNRLHVYKEGKDVIIKGKKCYFLIDLYTQSIARISLRSHRPYNP